MVWRRCREIGVIHEGDMRPEAIGSCQVKLGKLELCSMEVRGMKEEGDMNIARILQAGNDFGGEFVRHGGDVGVGMRESGRS